MCAILNVCMNGKVQWHKPIQNSYLDASRLRRIFCDPRGDMVRCSQGLWLTTLITTPLLWHSSFSIWALMPRVYCRHGKFAEQRIDMGCQCCRPLCPVLLILPTGPVSNRAASRAKDDHHRPDEANRRANCVPAIRASSFDGPQPYQR